MVEIQSHELLKKNLPNDFALELNFSFNFSFMFIFSALSIDFSFPQSLVNEAEKAHELF